MPKQPKGISIDVNFSTVEHRQFWIFIQQGCVFKIPSCSAHIYGIILQIKRLVTMDRKERTYHVKLLPRRCNHIVYTATFLVGPVLGDFAEVVAADKLISVH